MLLNIKCVLIFCEYFIWNISQCKKNSARYYLKYKNVFTFFLSDFNKNWTSRPFSKKIQNIKFNQNSSTESRVVPCGLTNMTTLIVAFRNFANAPTDSETFAQNVPASCLMPRSKITRNWWEQKRNESIQTFTFDKILFYLKIEVFRDTTPCASFI